LLGAAVVVVLFSHQHIYKAGKRDFQGKNLPYLIAFDLIVVLIPSAH